MQGVIALDIDGTITHQIHSIPAEVVAKLEELHQQGWSLLFVTGRPFSWAYKALKVLKVPYVLAVQNGAIALEIPQLKILSRRYLHHSMVEKMNAIIQGEELFDFILYAGYEYGDVCYYRRDRFSAEALDYYDRRRKALDEAWVDVLDFNLLAIPSFPSLKFIGKEPEIERISSKIEKALKIHIPINKDPFDPTYFVAQATHSKATKGEVLKNWLSRNKNVQFVIAAGDDRNDLSMLELANIRVVMEDAPSELLSIADIIAPSVNSMGIIQGLTKAIEKKNHGR